jgi:hypothetical protein
LGARGKNLTPRGEVRAHGPINEKTLIVMEIRMVVTLAGHPIRALKAGIGLAITSLQMRSTLQVAPKTTIHNVWRAVDDRADLSEV